MEQQVNGASEDPLALLSASQYAGCSKRSGTNRSASTTRGGSPSRRSVTSMQTVNSTLSIDDASEILSLSDSTDDGNLEDDDTEWLVVRSGTQCSSKSKEVDGQALGGKENLPKDSQKSSMDRRSTNVESTLRWMNEGFAKPITNAGTSANVCQDEMDGLSIASRNVIRSMQLENTQSDVLPSSANLSHQPKCQSNVADSNTVEISMLNGFMAGLGFSDAASPGNGVGTPTVHRAAASRQDISTDVSNISQDALSMSSSTGLFVSAPSLFTPDCSALRTSVPSDQHRHLAGASQRYCVPIARETAWATTSLHAGRESRAASTSTSTEHLAATASAGTSGCFSLSISSGSDAEPPPRRGISRSPKQLCSSLQSLISPRPRAQPVPSASPRQARNDNFTLKGSSNTPQRQTPIRRSSQPSVIANGFATISRRPAPGNVTPSTPQSGLQRSGSFKQPAKSRSSRATPAAATLTRPHSRQNEELLRARQSVFGSAADLTSVIDPALVIADANSCTPTLLSNANGRRNQALSSTRSSTNDDTSSVVSSNTGSSTYSQDSAITDASRHARLQPLCAAASSIPMRPRTSANNVMSKSMQRTVAQAAFAPQTSSARTQPPDTAASVVRQTAMKQRSIDESHLRKPVQATAPAPPQDAIVLPRTMPPQMAPGPTSQRCVSRLAAPRISARSVSLEQPSTMPCAESNFTLLARDAHADTNAFF